MENCHVKSLASIKKELGEIVAAGEKSKSAQVMAIRNAKRNLDGIMETSAEKECLFYVHLISALFAATAHSIGANARANRELLIHENLEKAKGCMPVSEEGNHSLQAVFRVLKGFGVDI